LPAQAPLTTDVLDDVKQILIAIGALQQ